MKNQTLRIDQIQQAVVKIKETSVDTIFVKSRKREYVVARQLSMYFSRQFTRHSLTVIGERNGGRDHATVLHAIRTVNAMVETKDSLFVPDYYRILDLLNKTPGMIIQKKKRGPVSKRKLKRVKELIRYRVPLEIRERIINEMQLN